MVKKTWATKIGQSIPLTEYDWPTMHLCFVVLSLWEGRFALCVALRMSAATSRQTPLSP